jgi:hypothetical protein
MKQLDEAGDPVAGFPDSSRHTGGKEYEEGTHLFAFSFHDIASDLIQQRNTAFHGSPELSFKDLNVFCNGGLYFLE